MRAWLCSPLTVLFPQAFAEEIHERVRTEVWGYAEEEKLEAADLHKIQYQVFCLVAERWLLQVGNSMY